MTEKNYYRLELVRVEESATYIEFNHILRLDGNEADRLVRVIKEALKQAKLDEETLAFKEVVERYEAKS